jgi:outer membrane protein OmpA-like peptidoglycan-associated protein/tetratricopeptide (TPR) repeat protein
MNKALFISIFLLVLSASSYAQNCEYTPSKNIQKSLDKASESKKYSSEDRIVFLEKAIEEDPECLPCLLQLGEMKFLRAKRLNSGFEDVIKIYEDLKSKCEDYHSEMYYYLGAMNYASQHYSEATEYFEKFLRFPDGDPSKFNANYDKKYKEVEEALLSVKTYNKIFNGNKNYVFVPKKVTGVSTASDEYLPMISPDGEILFFTRLNFKQAKGDITGRQVEEFTWSKRKDINAGFDKGDPLEPPFNKGGSYGGATLSIDNKELIIAKSNPVEKNPNNIDLFSTKFERVTKPDGTIGYVWSEWVSLGEGVNTPDGWEAQPSLSGDGQTLIFAGVRPECMKDNSGNYTHDLFVSRKQADGTWGKCTPLPSSINTAGQEKAPFIHSDSHTIYFSSDGHLGVGGMDFFYAKMNDDGTFSDVENIGAPINDDSDQIGIIVSSDGELAYFGANKYMGEKSYDIFQFDLPEKAKPERVAIIKGEVKGDDGTPAQNASVTIQYAQSGSEEQVKVNNDDGSYAAVVRTNKKEDVVLKVEGENIAFNAHVISKKDNDNPAAILKLNLETSVVAENKPFVINDIYYSTSSTTISEESKLILIQFADYLKDHPTWIIELRGHTDNIGDDKSNEALSLGRANQVKDFLVSNGVKVEQLSAKGFGKSKPVASNDTEAGRAKNRRTEFVIKKL